MEPGKELSRNSRCGLLFAAWAGAAAASAIPYGPGILAYVWLFPLGLNWLVTRHDLPEKQATYPALFAGWVIYAALSGGTFLQTRRTRYLLIYSLLCLMLALNVTGCHLMVGSIRM